MVYGTRRIFFLTGGLLLAVNLLAMAPEAKSEEGKGSLLSRMWEALGYSLDMPEDGEYLAAKTPDGADKEVVAQKMTDQGADAPVKQEVNKPASLVEKNDKVNEICDAKPVLAPGEKERSPAALPEKPAHDPSAIDEALFESRINQFAHANQELYNEARALYLAQKSKPFVYFITSLNRPINWLGLIDLGIDRHEITSADIMWIVEEYAHNRNTSLFEQVIRAHLHDKKASALIELLTTIDLPAKNGFFSRYRDGDRFNVLAKVLELGYTKAFKDIITSLPANDIDTYASVTLKVNNKDETYTLSSWLLRDAGRLSSKGSKHIIDSAVDLIKHRFSADFRVGQRDIWFDTVDLATVLLSEKHLGQQDYSKASGRFMQKPEKISKED